METILITAILTAMLSSAGTVLLAQWMFERRYRHRLETEFQRKLDVLRAAIESQVKAGVIDGVAEADIGEQLDVIEERVRAAVLAAATDEEMRTLFAGWADDLEQRVRQGVKDAVVDLGHPDAIRDATINVAEVGSSLIADGLNSLLGSRHREPKDNP